MPTFRFSDTLCLVLAVLMTLTAFNSSLGVRLVLTALSAAVIMALLIIVQKRAKSESDS